MFACNEEAALRIRLQLVKFRALWAAACGIEADTGNTEAVLALI